MREKKDPVTAALDRARTDAERDHTKVGEVVADMSEKANTVLERLRKKAIEKKNHLRLVAAKAK